MSARTILKYVLRPDDGVAALNLPTGSVVRHVGHDPNNLLAMWIEQDVIGKGDPKSVTMTERRFQIVGTGATLPALVLGPTFVGTAATPGQQMVWHIFEVA